MRQISNKSITCSFLETLHDQLEYESKFLPLSLLFPYVTLWLRIELTNFIHYPFPLQPPCCERWQNQDYPRQMTFFLRHLHHRWVDFTAEWLLLLLMGLSFPHRPCTRHRHLIICRLQELFSIKGLLCRHFTHFQVMSHPLFPFENHLS